MAINRQRIPKHSETVDCFASLAMTEIAHTKISIVIAANNMRARQATVCEARIMKDSKPLDCNAYARNDTRTRHYEDDSNIKAAESSVHNIDFFKQILAKIQAANKSKEQKWTAYGRA